MVTHTHLKKFIITVFTEIGCSPEDAETAADVLVAADLRGIDSHGAARLPGYIRLWEQGRINPKPNIKIIRETESTATVDGDRGLGLVVAPKAMEIAIEKAKKVGSGRVAVRNSNHFGIAGYHAALALKYDMIGTASTNASPLVAPPNSKEQLLGTNPFAFAVPAGEEPPFIADFATTTVANGKLEIRQRQNKAAELGWVQDKNGQLTDDVFALQKGGALVPLGGDLTHGSHKGYALGAYADILSGVLSGAGYGPWVPPFVGFLDVKEDGVGKGIGHYVDAMRIDGFMDVSTFKSRMDHFIRRFRNAETTGADPVLIPGDPERETEKVRLQSGIPLADKVAVELEKLAEKFGVDF